MLRRKVALVVWRLSAECDDRKADEGTRKIVAWRKKSQS